MKRSTKIFIFSISFCITVILCFVLYAAIALPDKAATDTDTVRFGSIFSADFDYTDTVPAAAGTGESNVSKSSIKLFDTIPVKNINITKTARRYVYPGGELVGIRLNTDGVIVVGTEEFYSNGRKTDPAGKAGIKVGDIIVSVNGTKITGNDEFSEKLIHSDGHALNIDIMRNDKMMTVKLSPELSDITNMYKGGLWIRDCTSGIGTLTFTDPETQTVATLGHGIYDSDTKKILPALSGEIMSASLCGITKGKSGEAGEIHGMIGSEKVGKLYLNCSAGIYGKSDKQDNNKELIPVAFASEVKTGKAEIISTLDNDSKKHYEIEIERINYNENDSGKNMIIKVTDKALKGLTGGIIQGMSGSPIIQNGRLVGAVTHVFLNDPLMGYGIFAENMVNVSDNISVQEAA